MPDFVPLAEHIVDAILETSPGLAAYAGDHRFDDRLPDFSADAVAGDVAMLRDAGAALAYVDGDALDPEDRVDHASLFSLVDRALFELTEVREHEWNPLEHNPGNLLFGLIHRQYAPVEVRLTSIAARLSGIPDALATARAVLTDCPQIHLETAIGQFAGVATMIRDDLTPLLAEVPAFAEVLAPLQRRAINALREFVRWLRDRRDEGKGRDPRLGRRLWEARLWHTLDTELTAAEGLAGAQATVERVRAQLREATGSSDDAGIRAALGSLAAQRPDNATIVGRAAETLAEATDFVGTHGLVATCWRTQIQEDDRGCMGG